MKRDYNFDLMRIFLCLCVIAVHSIGYFGINNNYVYILLTTFLLQANGLFYMISGYFNLNKEFNSSKDIIKFYKNTIIRIVVPFLVFVLFWTVWEYVHVTESFDLLELLGIYYESIMNSSNNTHLWFMYPYFGLLLSTPFLSKMVHNMDEKELKILWYVILGFNIVGLYLCNNFDIGFKVSAMFLDGWYLYYFGGYYYRRVASNEKTIKWAILGIAGFALTIVGRLYLDNFNSSTDISTLFTLFCLGCLLFWDKAIKINNNKIQKVIGFLSRYTFYIYLFHMRAIEVVQHRIITNTGNVLSNILLVILTFVVSLVAAIVTDFLLKPVQKLIDKAWKVK